VTGSITVMRGNPLSVPWALLLAAVGGACIVLGFVLPVGAEFPGGRVLDVILWTVAAIVALPGWLLAFVILRNTRRERRRPIAEVPDELAEPPSDHDPARIAVLVGEGRPNRRAIAGTMLELAHRGVLEIEEYGDRLVVRVRADAEPAGDRERLLLDGLRENADPSGDIVGPPIWKRPVRWWRTFARDARNQAMTEGLVDAAIPFVAFTIAFTFTAVGVSFALFERVLVFVGIIPFAIGITHALGNVGGYKLTHAGRELRARWAAYARYLAEQGSLRDVGPAAVAIWGPNLAYGAVLGQAERAAVPLTPGATEEDVPTPFETVVKV
jgi:hypothetical protein